MRFPSASTRSCSTTWARTISSGPWNSPRAARCWKPPATSPWRPCERSPGRGWITSPRARSRTAPPIWTLDWISDLSATELFPATIVTLMAWGRIVLMNAAIGSDISLVDETSLRLSEQQFKLLVESVTDYAIYMIDPEGRVSSWNAGAQRIKGYQPGEIIGENFSRFYTKEDRETG